MAVIDKKLIRFKSLASFESRLNAGDIKPNSIVFIEDAKRIWTQDSYYYCPETIEWSKITNLPTNIKTLGITDVYTKEESDDLYLEINGIAVAAEKWSTPRTIELTGAVTGSVSIDGSKNVTLDTEVNHVHNEYDNQNAFATIKVGSNTINADAVQDSVEFVAGNNVQLGISGDKLTISATDTTYVDATTSKAGLMSTTDKGKLDSIERGAQVNTITGVKGNSESTYRTGNVNITASNIGLGNVTNESKATMFNNAALTGTPTAPTAAADTNTTQIATTAFVQSEISNKIAAAEAMRFKGTLGTGGTILTLPQSHKVGDTYKVITAGEYAGVKCEVGDMIICITTGTSNSNSHWSIVQSNIDGAVTGPASSTDAHIATFSGATGKVIKDSGFTIAKSVPSDAKFTDTDTKVTSVENHYTPSANSGSTLSVAADSNTVASWETTKMVTGVNIQRDAKGHVTGLTLDSVKMPSNPNVDTTYTFSGGTNSFSVTPKNGTAQTVTVTPSITNNVTYTGTLVDEQVVTFEGTSGQVKASGFTIAKSVPSNAIFTDTTYDIVSTTASGLMSSAMLTKLNGIATGATANTGTVTKITAGTGLTGGNITTTGTIALATSGVTAGSVGPTAAANGTTNTVVTVAVPRITVDAYGRVTAISSYDLTCQNTTYSNATTSAAGLMSATDKTNLDRLVSKTLVEGNGTVTNVVSLTQAQYDALGSKSATTLYIVTD